MLFRARNSSCSFKSRASERILDFVLDHTRIVTCITSTRRNTIAAASHTRQALHAVLKIFPTLYPLRTTVTSRLPPSNSDRCCALPLRSRLRVLSPPQIICNQDSAILPPARTHHADRTSADRTSANRTLANRFSADRYPLNPIRCCSHDRWTTRRSL